MVKKHIKRDYSAHKKSVIRPTNEYCKLEIFSYDHPETMYYSRYENNIVGENIKEDMCLSWLSYTSADGVNRLKVDCNYAASEFGEYRIDILYQAYREQDYTGFISIYDKENNKLKEDEYMFDNELNVVKRVTAFYNLDAGQYRFHLRIPVNCHFLGVIIRKIKTYTGDNIDSAETNMMFINATVTNSGMVKPTELSCTIGYDDAFECLTSPSGFYFDYRDEINVYIKDDDDELRQIFGGYISSILPDSDRTKLTITAADRLVDGQNKYVMDSMYLLGGTKKDEDYDDQLYHDFNNYGQALKFLCDIMENTLQNNINENYLVAGEAYETGLAVTFGDEGNAKNVHATEMSTTNNTTFVTVRNNPSAEKYQAAYVYDVKDYNIDPVDITDFPNFYITYGLGDPKQEVAGSGSGGGGASSKGKTIVVGCDINDHNDAKIQNAIISALNNAGYQTERLPIGPNYFANYSYHGARKGKVGVYIIAAGTYAIADYYYGACKGTTFDRAIFPIRGDISSQPGGREPGFSTRPIGADPDCPSWLCSHIRGLTFPQMNEKLKDRVTIVGGSTIEQIAQNVVTACNGGSPGASGDGNSGNTVSADSVFKAISEEAFKYRYCLGCGSSSWSTMQSVGYGDCWAFSEFIFTKLKGYGVSCRIVQYDSGYAGNHRSVLYLDANGEWKDFPYREYGWSEKYDRMLNNTSNSKNGSIISSFDGKGIDGAVGAGDAKKTVVGYDKDKPLQFYIEFIFSNDKVNTHSYVLNATARSNHDSAMGRISPIWINNVVKQATINVKDYMAEIVGDDDQELKYYIHSIRLKAPKQVEAWYTTDENNVDEASCKMDLYGLGFNQGTIVNPTDLSSCGKSIISEMESLVKDSGYLVDMEYSKHRKDDVINFMVDNQTTPAYVATEGDDNNILSWSSISYTPISNLFNNSVYVYKKEFEKGMFYRYVNSKFSTSVLKYGEQTTLQSNSETITDREAYYNARRKSDKFNPYETFSYTITVPFAPDIDIGDIVKVVADAKKLNTIKRVQSVKYVYDNSKIPRIQTTLGLDELEPKLQLKKTLQELRDAAKKDSTLFSTTAQGIEDKNLYQWEN